jgi:hypothetical protein
MPLNIEGHFFIIYQALTFHNPGLTFHNPGLTFHNPGLTFHNPGLTFHNPGLTFHGRLPETKSPETDREIVTKL